MAVDRHVEFAFSGVNASANESRLFHLPRPCLVHANLVFRQPQGSGEEPKAILAPPHPVRLWRRRSGPGVLFKTRRAYTDSLIQGGGELAVQEISRKKPILANRTAPEIEARIV
ncbi:MAG: hypothetical protein ACRDRT_05135, partial [Pseudonocardiaceae bacterium]